MLERMTGNGMRLALSMGRDAGIGDRVRLKNGLHGTVHCWAALGAIVMVDRVDSPAHDGIRVAAYEAGDGDIEDVLSRYGS